MQAPFLLLTLFIPFIQAISRLDENVQFFTEQPWSAIESSFFFTDVYSYYSINQVRNLLNNYQANFPEVIAATVKIGETSQGRDILAVQLATEDSSDQSELPLSSNINDDVVNNVTTFQNKYYDRPAILFTGMHDGNDPISMTMVLYILKRFLSGYYKKEPEYLYLLSKRQIWLVPMINQDSYYKMNEDITEISIVKNQQVYGYCESENIGVNLKLNYIPFIEDQESDNQDECDMLYRGPLPFSEPETEALNNLIDMVDFSLAINYFSRQNTVLLPFNYLDKDDFNSTSLYRNPEDKQVFFDLYEKSGLKSTTFFGNNYGKRKEVLIGEVSDYMYHHKNIYSLTVELGNEKISSTTFPLNFTGNMAIFESFYPMALYSTFKLGNQFEWTLLYQLFEVCLEQHLAFMDCRGSDRQVYSAKFQLANSGILTAEFFTIEIDVPDELEIVTISLQSEYSYLYNFNDSYFTETPFVCIQEDNLRSCKIQAEFLPRMSQAFIGINAIYKSSLPPTQGITISIPDNLSYDESQGTTEALENFGGVSGFHKIVKDDILEEGNPRMLSIILMGVYFVGMGFTFVVSMCAYGASKFKEPTTLSPY